ncbi:unnamed protein product [Microthlaspi erraticum]|uniref:Uncharacterized protein n=1 Tax=Microthlaspi erraticum TaxID=1685480 RepID=A0A6D2JIS8_9BRAS|nr:unnamed protein product [Microthlaspi erraticum]
MGASRPQYKQFTSSGCKWASVWTVGFVWVQVGLSADRCGLVWVQVGLSTSGEDLRCCGLARSGFVVFVTFVGIRGRIQFSGGEL